MKLGAILALTLSAFLAPAGFAAEGTSQASLDNLRSSPQGPYKFRIVPQVGMSSLQYTGRAGGSPGNTLSGGLTTEVGQTKQRLLEFGIVLLNSNGTAKVGISGASEKVSMSQIAIPLMGKIRFINTKTQDWYAKVGVLTAFQTFSDHEKKTAPFDVMGSAGIGARVPTSKSADVILEATYNRGMLNAFRDETSVREGLMFFTGISFGI